MSTEHPRYSLYAAVVEQAENLTFQTMSGEVGESNPLAQLVIVAINAFAGGLTRESIRQAVEDGTEQGAVLYHNVQTGGHDLAYWRAVRAEAQAFWDKRYDPDAKEEW